MIHFYGVYISDRSFAAALDVIRFLGQPDAIRFAHITLRGPYHQQELNDTQLFDLNQKVHRWSVEINGVDSFTSASQATIYLRVHLHELARLWHKPDFPEGTPHLTIYDGSDHEYSQRLLDVLSLHEWRAKLKVSKLKYIDMKAPTDVMSIALLHDFHSYFSFFVGLKSDLIFQVPLMTKAERLRLTQRVIVKLGLPLVTKDYSFRARRAKNALTD